MLNTLGLFHSLYLEINLFGSVLMFVLILKLVLNSRIKGQQYFRRLLTWNIVLFLSDAVSVLMQDGSSDYTDSFVVFAKSIYFIAVFVLTCECFLYFEACRDSALMKDRGKTGLVTLPVFFFILLIIINLHGQFLFYVDENGLYQRGRAFLLIYLLSFFYTIFSMIRSFADAFRRDNFAVRGRYVLYGLYPLVPVVAGILQFFTPEIPVLCPVLSISAVIIYVNAMEYLIYLDSLTGLKNRRLFLYDMTLMMHHLRPGQKLCFAMIDLNDFKSINDSYGHNTGDLALQIIGDAMTECLADARNRSVLCRYGGDEFAILLCSEDSSEMDLYLENIRQKTETLSTERRMPCPITFSAGISEWDGTEDTKSFIAGADQKMYKVKSSARHGR